MSDQRREHEDDDEYIGQNNTFDGLLRKLNDGDAINAFGAELQRYIADMRRSSRRQGKRVVGKVTLEITIPMGVDGYIQPVAKLTTRALPKPPWPESIIYTDEDGDINGLPVPKQVGLFEVKKTNIKEAAAQAAKGM